MSKNLNNTKINQEDQVFFDLNKKTVNAIKPEKELLSRILDRIEMKNVTENNLVRNSSQRVENIGRGSTINNFTKLINNMNNYIKILSGGAIASALIIAMVLINKTDDKVLPLGVQDIGGVTQTKVEIDGEVLDVDSLLTDLNSIDFAYDEPVLDDSDLTASLINTNDYEIQ